MLKPAPSVLSAGVHILVQLDEQIPGHHQPAVPNGIDSLDQNLDTIRDWIVERTRHAR